MSQPEDIKSRRWIGVSLQSNMELQVGRPFPAARRGGERAHRVITASASASAAALLTLTEHLPYLPRYPCCVQ